MVTPAMVAPTRDVPAAVDDAELAPRGVRPRDLALAPLRILGALFLPDRTLPGAVAAGRYAAPLIAVMLCAAVAAWSVGVRLDSRQDVAQRANAVAGTEEAMSDRDVAEAIVKERRVGQVKLGLAAGLSTPTKVILLGLALFLLARYVGGKPTLRGAITTAACGALPGAVKALVAAGGALRAAVLTPAEGTRLLDVGVLDPGRGPLAAVLAVHPFELWSVLLIGYGLAEAAGMSRRRAFLAVGAAYILYRLLLVALGGPPPQPPHPGMR
jgi:hypothetical protein